VFEATATRISGQLKQTRCPALKALQQPTELPTPAKDAETLEGEEINQNLLKLLLNISFSFLYFNVHRDHGTH